MKILLANKFFYIKGAANFSLFQMAKLLERNNHILVFFLYETSAKLSI